MEEQLTADKALGILGKVSRWHLLKCLPISFGYGLSYSWSIMSLMFIGDTPPHHCRLAGNATVNYSIPQEIRDGKWTWSQCQMFADDTNGNNTQTCTDGYWYDPEAGYESTVVTEFDLVCDKNGWAEFSMMLNGIGQTIGAPFFSFLSDFCGRKPTFLGCLWTKVVVGIILAFSPSFPFYATLLFFDGCVLQGIVACAFVLSMEHFSKEQRTISGVILETAYGICSLLLAPILYLLRNWRHLQMTISFPLCITVTFYWLIEESVPWLLANGRVEEAEEIIRTAGKTNKVRELLYIYRTVTSLVGNRYLNFFLYSLVDIPATNIAGYFLRRYGRVRPLCGFHFLCGTALIATFVQTLDLRSARVPLTVFLSVAGKFAVDASFLTIALITPELYPTAIRNICQGGGQFAASVAAFIVPFARMLGRHNPWMPAVIFGITSMIAGVLALILPETRWRPLPETVQEVEQWRHQPKFYKLKLDDISHIVPIDDIQASNLSVLGQINLFRNYINNEREKLRHIHS